MIAIAVAAACVVFVAGAAGCGRGSSPAAVSGPTALVARSVAALRAAPGVHFAGSLTEDGSTGAITGRSLADGDGMARIDGVQTRHVAGRSYLKADAAFWAGVPRSARGRLADRWVLMPADGDQDRDDVERFTPTRLARCLGRRDGTLRATGRKRVAGAAVDVVEDLGDRPGSERRRLALAARGTPYPLRFEQLAPRRDGGTSIPACGADSSDRARLVFSHFDDARPIPVPAGAVSFAELLGR